MRPKIGGWGRVGGGEGDRMKRRREEERGSVVFC